MIPLGSTLLIFLVLSVPAHTRGDGAVDSPGNNAEKLGTVSFSNSCSQSVQKPLERGVALLHDFWYEEAQQQFEEVSKADPGCAIAHWGSAMSEFHQIWERPGERVMQRGWAELQKAQSPTAKTDREREYISAARAFFEPRKQEYQARVDGYSAAMAKLYADYPNDVDAGAFYALSLLADESPTDTSLSHNRKALALLTPLFAKNPDHPGVAHYIIHACDNPSMASQGLEAANRYGSIAPTAPHAAHMPSHIYARLGMWPEDIRANLASVAASQRADEKHESGVFNQLHADDFLLYAYLQSGQERRAKSTLDHTSELLQHMQDMPDMPMAGMLPYYRSKFPVFYNLEMRDWKSAAALETVAGAPPQVQTLTYWARIVAAGHLHQAAATRADVLKYDGLVAQVRNSEHAYSVETTGAQIERYEVLAWSAFAEGNKEKALSQIRAAADLQDKVGQGEVDIPAREMLADMLLEFHHPQQALVEYDSALQKSPNRFNGLYNAGLAAEAAGDKARAAKYYSVLLKTTDNGAQSGRQELAHAKGFFSSTQAMTR